MSHTLQLKNRKYRNWVRAGLGLKYVKDGLVDFVDSNLKQIHSDVVTNIQKSSGLTTVSCQQCNVRYLAPNHVRGPDKRCPLRLSNCNCQYPSGKDVCPQGLCGVMYDEIIQQHASVPPCPYWKNTNARLWSCDHLEFGKCFINAPGYADKSSLTEMDASGLLHIIINNKAIQNHIRCAITGHDVFSKTRQARNHILHSGTMELDDAKVDAYIDDMVTLLQDDKELRSSPKSVKAVGKLLKLKQTTFCITDIDEAEIIKDALEAVECKKEEAINHIEQIFEEKKRELGNIQSHEEFQASEDVAERLTVLEHHVQQYRTDHDNLKTDVESLQMAVASLRLQVDALEKAQVLKYERKQHLEKRAEFQKSLITLYRNHCTKVSIMPTSPEDHDASIDEVYVSPWMIVQNQSENIDGSTDEDNQNKPKHSVVKSYSQIFRKGDVQMKNIYLVGDAGVGKTTFCRNMLEIWCQAHAGKSTTLSADHAEMKKFEFLFYISLRHVHAESHINDMINRQLLVCCENPEIFSEVIESDSERCLIVLDGLDEWTPPEDSTPFSPYEKRGLPRRDLKKSYTVLTTTRQWKIGVLQLTCQDIDQQISLMGVDDNSIVLMGNRVVPRLNKRFKKNKKTDEFVAELEKSNITDLRYVPIMVQQLLCSWHDGKSLTESRCNTFCSMFDMLLCWSEKRGASNVCFRHLEKTVQLKLKQKAEKNKLPDLVLPRCFGGHEHCQMFILLIYFLGELAYHTLLSRNQERMLFFDDEFAHQRGLTDEEIDFAIKVGILSEDRMLTAASKGRSRFISYKHKSLQEFLCASYIAIHALSSKTKSWFSFFSTNKSEESSETVLVITQMFQYVNTVDRILEMSNMLLLLSGLYPRLNDYIIENVYQRVLEDTRLTLCADIASEMPQIVGHVQEFVLKCIQERLSNDPSNAVARLHGVNADSLTKGQMFEYIDPGSVRFLFFNGLFKNAEMVNFTAQVGVHENLQLISATDLSSNTTLLLIHNVIKQSAGTLEVLSVRNALFYIEEEIESIFHNQVALRCLQMKYILLTHQQLSTLFSALKMAETLYELELSDIQIIECTTNHRDSLDIGGLENLEVLKLEKFDFKIVEINKVSLRRTELHFIDLDNVYFAVNSISCLQGAKKMEKFAISFSGMGNQKYSHEIPDILVRTLPSFHQLTHLSLTNVNLCGIDLIFTPNMKVKDITLRSVSMSLNAWIKLLCSLFYLPGSVQVFVTPSMTLAVRNYIRNEREKFEIVYDRHECQGFCFKTIRSG